MKGGNSLAFLYHDINDLEHSNQVKLPRVSVVMPLKGFGEHNLHNWRSQVRFLWGILLASRLLSCCFLWIQMEELNPFTYTPGIPLSLDSGFMIHDSCLFIFIITTLVSCHRDADCFLWVDSMSNLFEILFFEEVSNLVICQSSRFISISI